MPRQSWRRLSWLFAFVTIGCVGLGADDAPMIATISSPPELGATVVNRDPSWTRASAWKLGSEPVVEIGGRRGNGPQDLLKVVGIVRMLDGSLVVGNGSAAELRYFDRKGIFVTGAGGRGTEPGSLEQLGWIQPLETGGIAAFDESARSVRVFDEQGGYVKSLMQNYDARNNGAFLSVVGVFDDESVLIQQSRITPRLDGTQRSEDWFVRAPKEGIPATVTGAFPGTELFRKHFINQSHTSQPPFGRSLHVAIAPTRFFVGDNDRYEISVFSSDGTLLHVVRLEGTERPVTREAIEEYMEDRIPKRTDLPRKYLEDQLLALITHGTMPAFDKLLSDEDGYLWVRDFDYRLPADRDERWNIFDPNGRYLGALEMPASFSLTTITPKYIAGVSKNAGGAEIVRVYELKKPARK